MSSLWEAIGLVVLVSFMGYQGFPANLSGWKSIYGPAVRDRLLAEQVDCVLLSTA